MNWINLLLAANKFIHPSTKQGCSFTAKPTKKLRTTSSFFFCISPIRWMICGNVLSSLCGGSQWRKLNNTQDQQGLTSATTTFKNCVVKCIFFVIQSASQFMQEVPSTKLQILTQLQRFQGEVSRRKTWPQHSWLIPASAYHRSPLHPWALFCFGVRQS